MEPRQPWSTSGRERSLVGFIRLGRKPALRIYYRRVIECIHDSHVTRFGDLSCHCGFWDCDSWIPMGNRPMNLHPSTKTR